jgi:hypothetical protein
MELNNMTRPTIRIHDIAIDEIIDREMTDAEFAQYEIDQANATAEKIEAESKAVQRQEILDRLGLSQEEANILLGGN